MRNRSIFSIVMVAVLSIVLFSCSRVDDPPATNPDDNWPSDSIRVLKGGLSFPWEIVWGKDDHIWMTERGGRVSRIDPRIIRLRVIITGRLVTEIRKGWFGPITNYMHRNMVPILKMKSTS